MALNPSNSSNLEQLALKGSMQGRAATKCMSRMDRMVLSVVTDCIIVNRTVPLRSLSHSVRCQLSGVETLWYLRLTSELGRLGVVRDTDCNGGTSW